MTDRRYLITERPMKALLMFSIPIMLGNLFQQLYTMADSVIVGRFVGEKALAAVGASYSLTSVFIAVAIGGGMGASVVTSRAFGSSDFRKMKESISTSLVSFLFISIILAIFGYIFSHRILMALNTPYDVIGKASAYLRIYFLGLPFLFMYNVLSSMFNALGRSKVPLFLLIFSSVLNVILDIIMVGPLGMGVEGAGWATLIAQGLSAVISFMVLIRLLSSFDGKADKLWDRTLLSSILRIALPSILQQSTVSIGMMLVQSVVNGFGSEVLAGFSAAMRIESIVVGILVNHNFLDLGTRIGPSENKAHLANSAVHNITTLGGKLVSIDGHGGDIVVLQKKTSHISALTLIKRTITVNTLGTVLKKNIAEDILNTAMLMHPNQRNLGSVLVFECVMSDNTTVRALNVVLSYPTCEIITSSFIHFDV